MTPILIRVDNENAFASPAAVGAPVGEPVAMACIAGHTETPNGGAGLWECTPGRFRRQVAQAEYSYFIEGEGSFTLDGGDTVEFHAGDSIWFAPDTQGEWNIRKTVRKAYLILS